MDGRFARPPLTVVSICRDARRRRSGERRRKTALETNDLIAADFSEVHTARLAGGLRSGQGPDVPGCPTNIKPGEEADCSADDCGERMSGAT